MKNQKLTDLEIAIKIEEIEREETIKQTAVDYLFQKLWTFPKDKMVWQHYLQKAKQMEKEQIEKTARKCHFEGVRQSAKTSEDYIKYGEEYYKETYEKDA